MPIGVKFDVRGLAQVRNLLDRAARNIGGNRAVLHQRYGIQAMNWVQRNFRTEGGLLSTGPWKKLSPNTIAGRRQGSSRILQDTGAAGLMGSFTMEFDADHAAVGTAKTYAPYHERGTGPYEIRPKNKKFLAFPAVGGKPLKVATNFPSSERKYPAGTPFVFTKGPIHHPGLPKRRMLPNATELLPQLIRTTINFAKEIAGRGEQL